MSKILKEDVNITDPNLAQQYSNGKQQLVNKDQQINALNKQILKLQTDKIAIQKALDGIEKKAADQQSSEQSKQETTQSTQDQTAKQNKDLEDAQRALASQILMTKQASESLVTIARMNIDDMIESINESILDAVMTDADLSVLKPLREELLVLKRHKIAINENNNPFSYDDFYDKSTDIEPSVMYLKIIDGKNTFIAKIYKEYPDSDWFGKVIHGRSKTFGKMKYDSSYEEDDIINFLKDSYDEVKMMSESEFNDYENTIEGINPK